jgi:glucose dehydrogenase
MPVSPTQPLSGYHTLAFPNLTEADMWGVAPLDQLWCRIEFKRSHYEGICTPPTSDQNWTMYPDKSSAKSAGVEPAHERFSIANTAGRLHGMLPIRYPSRIQILGE